MLTSLLAEVDPRNPSRRVGIRRHLDMLWKSDSVHFINKNKATNAVNHIKALLFNDG